MTTLLNSYSGLLRALIKFNGFDVKSFSHSVGYREENLLRILNNDASIPFELIMRISEVYGVSFSDFGKGYVDFSEGKIGCFEVKSEFLENAGSTIRTAYTAINAYAKILILNGVEKNKVGSKVLDLLRYLGVDPDILFVPGHPISRKFHHAIYEQCFRASSLESVKKVIRESAEIWRRPEFHRNELSQKIDAGFLEFLSGLIVAQSEYEKNSVYKIEIEKNKLIVKGTPTDFYKSAMTENVGNFLGDFNVTCVFDAIIDKQGDWKNVRGNMEGVFQI